MTNPSGTDPSQGLGVPTNGPAFLPPAGAAPLGSAQPSGTYGAPAGTYGAPGTYSSASTHAAPGTSGQPSYPVGPSGQPSYPAGPYNQPPYPAGPYNQPSYPPGPYSQPETSAFTDPRAYPLGGPAAPSGYGTPGAPPPRTGHRGLTVVVVLMLAVGLSLGLYGLVNAREPVFQPTPTRSSTLSPSASPSSSKTSSTSTSKASASPTLSRTSAAPTSAAPSSSSTSGDFEDCMPGDVLSTSAFTATVPSGWACDGEDGDLSLYSDNDDGLWVDHEAGAVTTASCRSQVETVGTATSLGTVPWGRATATLFVADTASGRMGIACTTVGAMSYYVIFMAAETADDARVTADAKTLMRTWVWK